MDAATKTSQSEKWTSTWLFAHRPYLKPKLDREPALPETCSGQVVVRRPRILALLKILIDLGLPNTTHRSPGVPCGSMVKRINNDAAECGYYLYHDPKWPYFPAAGDYSPISRRYRAIIQEAWAAKIFRHDSGDNASAEVERRYIEQSILRPLRHLVNAAKLERVIDEMQAITFLDRHDSIAADPIPEGKFLGLESDRSG
ncbi:Hypothetical protein D9617_4g003940 [Elsinoe fawcettii]|nr:Hypothetical protein D9617_4g003940 [Elsinoe fawcettii]